MKKKQEQTVQPHTCIQWQRTLTVASFMAVSRPALRSCCSCNLIFSMSTLQTKKQNCVCSLKCSFILKFTENHPSLSLIALGSKLSLLDNVALSVVGTLEIYRKESLFHENQWQKLPGFCSVVQSSPIVPAIIVPSGAKKYYQGSSCNE